MFKSILAQAQTISDIAKTLSIVAKHSGEALEEIAKIFPQSENKPVILTEQKTNADEVE